MHRFHSFASIGLAIALAAGAGSSTAQLQWHNTGALRNMSNASTATDPAAGPTSHTATPGGGTSKNAAPKPRAAASSSSLDDIITGAGAGGGPHVK